MADEKKLDTLFYEIEARTDKLDSAIKAAAEKLKQLDSAAPSQLVVNMDTTGLLASLNTAIDKIEQLEKLLNGVSTDGLEAEMQGLQKSIEDLNAALEKPTADNLKEGLEKTTAEMDALKETVEKTAETVLPKIDSATTHAAESIKVLGEESKDAAKDVEAITTALGKPAAEKLEQSVEKATDNLRDLSDESLNRVAPALEEIEKKAKSTKRSLDDLSEVTLKNERITVRREDGVSTTQRSAERVELDSLTNAVVRLNAEYRKTSTEIREATKQLQRYKDILASLKGREAYVNKEGLPSEKRGLAQSIALEERAIASTEEKLQQLSETAQEVARNLESAQEARVNFIEKHEAGSKNLAEDLSAVPSAAQDAAQSLQEGEKAVKRFGEESDSTGNKFKLFHRIIEDPKPASILQQSLAALKEKLVSLGNSLTSLVTKNRFTVIALNTTAAVLSTLAVAAVTAAAKLDTPLRQIQAATGATAEEMGKLRDAIRGLSFITPRTQVELAELAKTIADIGITDTAQIESTMRAVLLASDALGATDLRAQVKVLDDLKFAFEMTSKEARDTYLQIAAMAKGNASLESLAEAVSGIAPSLKMLGASAITSAQSIVTLMKNGQDANSIIATTNSIVEKSVKAHSSAAKATGQKREALTALAKTVNSAQIQERGLLGVLSDLHKEMGGSEQKFAAAGLSVKAFSLASAAAEAEADGASTKTLSLSESMKELNESAAITRTGAEALYKIIKSELMAVLIDLGNLVLPTVTKMMNAFANMLSKTRREASGLRESLTSLEKLDEVDKSGNGVALRNQNFMAQNQSRRIVNNPHLVEVFDEDEMKRYIDLLDKIYTRRETIEGKFFTNSTAAKEMTEALAHLRDGYERLTKSANDAGNGVEKVPPEQSVEEIESLAKAVKKAQKDFDDLTKAAIDFANGMNSQDPMLGVLAQQRQFRESMDEIIEKLPKVRQAGARLQAGTILGQISDEIAKLRASKASEITESLAATMISLSGDAVAQLEAEYAGLVKQVEEYANVAEILDTEESRATAKRARESIPEIQRQGKALAELTRLQKEFEASTRRLADAPKSAILVGGMDMAFVHQIEAHKEMLELEEKLRAIINDTTQSLRVRKQAEDQLREAVEKRREIENKPGPKPEIDEWVQTTKKLGQGMMEVAQAALAVSQAMGKGNTATAQMLAGVISVGNGMRGLAEAAEKHGGFGKMMGSGMGILEAIPWIGSIFGGFRSIWQSMDLTGKEAKKAAALMAERIEEGLNSFKDLTRKMQVEDSGQFSKEWNSYFETLADNIRDQSEKFGVTIRATTLNLDSVKALRTETEKKLGELFAIAPEMLEKYSNKPLTGATKNLEDFFAEIEGLGRFIEMLDGMMLDIEAQTKIIQERQKAELESRQASDNIRRLILAGRAEEADAAKKILDLNREREQAWKDLSAGGEEAGRYLSELSDLIDEEIRAAHETAILSIRQKELADSMKDLGRIARLAGLEGVDYLTALLDTYTKQLPELAGLLDGIDVMDGGVDVLRERILGIFDSLKADGITEAEEMLVDALFDILDATERAASGILTSAQKIDESFKEIERTQRITGASSGDSLRALIATILGEDGPIFGELRQLLSGDIDLGSSDGIEALRGNLRDYYTRMLEGGIDESEDAVTNVIEKILNWMDSLSSGLLKEAEEIEADRAKRADLVAKGRLAFEDLSDVEKFFVNMPNAVGDALREFDLESSEGLRNAGAVLKELFDSILSLTEEESLAKFGATVDQVAEWIFGANSELSTFADSMKTVADAAAEAARAATSFGESIDDDYLRAIGLGSKADILGIERWVADSIEQALQHGLGQDTIDKIRKIGTARIAEVMQRDRESALQDAEKAIEGESKDPRRQYVTSSVTGQSEATALRMNDYLASILVEERLTRIATEGLVSALLRGSAPTLTVPPLPNGAGGFASAAGGPVFIMNITVSGPILGQTSEEAAEQLGRALTPIISRYQARGAGTDASAYGGRI